MAEQALRLIGAEGHLVAGHDKNPVYPASNWQYHGNQLTIEQAMAAWKAWGSSVRGPGIVCRDSHVVFDFDEMGRVEAIHPQSFEDRKVIRANLEKLLMRDTYAERSRGGKGMHFIFKVYTNFLGRRGIEFFKKFLAIDVLTGGRYCDITGFRLNELPVADGAVLVHQLLTRMEERYADTDVPTGIEYAHGQYSAACLEELLQYVKVDPEDYTGWIEIGLALFNETSGSMMGLRLWDNWSAKFGGEKYTGSHNLTYKWGTFKVGKYKYSVGSILRRAKEGGANVARIRIKHNSLADISGMKADANRIKWGSK